MSKRLLGAGAALIAILIAVVILSRRSDTPSPATPESPPFVARPADFITDLDASETASSEAAGAVKAAFVSSFRDGKDEAARAAFAPDFLARFPAPLDGVAIPDARITIRRYPAAAGPDLDAQAFLSRLRSHLAGWVAVDRAVWRPYEFLIARDRSVARAAVHLQLSGRRADGHRADLRGSVAVELLPLRNWTIRRLEWLEGTRVEGNVPPFREITDPTGLHFNESPANRRRATEILNARMVRSLGGLSVVDWNRDGFHDLLATVWGRHTVLFLNDGQDGFVREELPLRTPEESADQYLFMDLDGDGLEELVGALDTGSVAGIAQLPVWTRRDGSWIRLDDVLTYKLPAGVRDLRFQSISPCDIDRNGTMDLWVGVLSDSESGKGGFNSVDATDGADNLLFVNHGSLRFTEESDQRGIRGTRYTYVGTWFDFDFDGDQDLLEINDWGKNQLFLNRGNGAFEEASGHPMVRPNAYSMGCTIGDWDNTGEWSVHISTMYSHAGNRIVPIAEALAPGTRALVHAIARGNYQWESAGGPWRETALARGCADADWAWGCIFVDLENDGDKDLFVTNGFTSHEDANAPDW